MAKSDFWAETPYESPRCGVIGLCMEQVLCTSGEEDWETAGSTIGDFTIKPDDWN